MKIFLNFFWKIFEIFLKFFWNFFSFLLCFLDEFFLLAEFVKFSFFFISSLKLFKQGQVFEFLQRVLISPLYEEEDKGLVKTAFIARFPDLLALNRVKTAQLTVSSLWSEVPRLLKAISSDIMLQYQFVKALFDFT